MQIDHLTCIEDIYGWQMVSGQKPPEKKTPDESHRAISHPSKYHIGQKHTRNKMPASTKGPQKQIDPEPIFPPKAICSPNQIALPIRSFSHRGATGFRV